MKILLNKQQHAALSHIAAWAIVVDRLLDKLVDARSIGAKDALRLLDDNTNAMSELAHIIAGSSGEIQILEVLMSDRESRLKRLKENA